MGGMPVVIIGYEPNESAVAMYIKAHDLEATSLTQGPHGDAFKKLLRHFAEVTSTPITLARIEDFDSESHYYLCCFTDSEYNFTWNCEDVMRQIVPEKFSEIIAPLSTDGIVKRVFASRGFLYSYHANGKPK
ncbi:hypothetical protein BD410DRAFT_840517 [Rickenella mellea]|uniref:Uncharacterized protein n=1 Tax=Rickenella mellea TaxID=50990 RepID=A0A4Y7Q1Q6_9AGAM|nr:hypothetical protein BD410DRAFT_840517 [Rickenella mellea]